MSDSNIIERSALVITIITLVSKILGFVRETLIASKFGSGMETDAFFVALTATYVVSSLISSSLAITFIPVISEVETNEGKGSKIRHTNNIINIVVVFSIILTLLASVFTPLIVRLTAKGFYGEQFELAIFLTRIGLPMILFAGIIGSLTGFLQSEQRHISASSVGIPFNLIYIVFLTLFSSRFGIKGLMIAAVVATFSQILIQIPEARKAGYRYKFVFDIKDKYIKKIMKLSLPVFLGTAIIDISAIIDRTLASDLDIGSISALNYGNRLNALVQSVFISAIITVIFPLLSAESSKGNIDVMKRIMKKGVKFILIITIPATFGIIILAKPLVQVVFESGEFTSRDTEMTAIALVFYSVGLVASSVRLLVTRVYYSMNDTKTPMINGTLNVGIDVVLNLILVKFMAHGGLAFASSIAIIISTLLLFYGLKKKIGSLGTKEYIICGIKSGVASAIMGIIVYNVYHKSYGVLGVSRLNNLVSLLVAIVIGVLVYVGLCYLFGINEVRDIIAKVRIKIRRIIKK